MTRHPGLWLTEFGNFGTVLGIDWDMTQKPGTAHAIAAPLVGLLVGAGLAYRFSSSRGEAAEPVGAAG